MKSELATTNEAQFQEMGQQLTTQYDKAMNGMLNLVLFGAMVSQVKKIVSTCGHDRSRGGGRDTAGEGLKAWLEKYAPTVSRARAYEFLKIAEGIRDTFQIGAKADLAELLQADPKKLADSARKKQEAILEAISGQSRRQLLLNFGGIGVPDSDKKKVGGHHPKQHDGPSDSPQDKAIDLWTPTIQWLVLDGDDNTWQDLPKEGPISLRTLKNALIELNQKLSAAGIK